MPKSKNMAGPLLGLIALIFGFTAIASFLLGATLAAWLCLLICLTALAIFARLRFNEFASFFVSRQARYGANVAISIIGVIGIAIFINVIVAQRFDKRKDLTQHQLHTLSEQTKNVLKSLNSPIHATAFFTGSANSPLEFERAKDMLALYERENEFLTVSFVNPYIDNLLADKYDVRDGTIVFESVATPQTVNNASIPAKTNIGTNRIEKVTSVDEQKFTNALLKLIRNETKKIYFLTGHEERSIDDLTPLGYSRAKEALENQNYAVLSFSSLLQPSIPADCAVLVIAAPKTALTQVEINLLTEYLARDGKLLLLFEPATSSNRELIQFMQKWGIEVGNDLVIDQARLSIYGATMILPDFEQHEITRALQGTLIPFRGTRSVTPIEDIPVRLSVKSLAKTVGKTGVSWGEAEFDRNVVTNPSYNPGIDTPPPVSIAAAVEEKKAGGPEQKDWHPNWGKDRLPRIVVFGDSDFASNYPQIGILRPENHTLFLAVINWLTLEEDLIAISPIDFQKLALRPMLAQEAVLVQILAVFLIPLIVFIAGLVVWWQRRS